jgi:hypothetical protein
MKRINLLLFWIVSVIYFLFPLSARADWFSCVPTEVIEFQNRIHVKCSNTHSVGTDRINYIAIDKRDLQKANRFVDLATAAMACGHVFRVDIPDSSTTNVGNCLANDCRTPLAFGMMAQ